MKSSVAAIRLEKIQLTETVLVLFSTMLLPILVHMLPNVNNQLAGMVFLPIFLAPLVAVFFFKKHVAIIAGLLAPALNYLLLGRPSPEMVLILSSEVVGFVLLLGWLKNFSRVRFLAAPVSYIVSSFFAALIISYLGIVGSPFAFWTNAVIVGSPGILLMAALNLAILKFKK
ncbi:hypothetical protein ACUNWD_16455 [Sunxiuqinia sp. A32]|uniref:hypothetical protein n=1 Tax=Sunxiuqinia sp. A32 TaxID=3461496 RepID=UPI0040464EBD